MKQRLHHVALALPQLPFARHDALAEQDPDAVEAHTLGVVAMIGDQHPLDVVGMMNDVGVRFARGHVHAIGVAVAGKQLDHALQGIVRGADVELQPGCRRLVVRGLGGGHASC